MKWLKNFFLTKSKPELSVTLWPSFPHFKKFAADKRLAGIRMNTAMVDLASLDKEFELAKDSKVPLWFDIKGRQLRVTDVFEYKDHLELEINHPIKVDTPTPVLLKAGSDHCCLKEVVNGRRLIFEGGPYYRVKVGESLHIRDKSLEVSGDVFTDFEVKKIEKAVKAGLKRYYLSYVESDYEVNQFLEMIPRDSELILKIESQKGLDYVKKSFKKTTPNISLMAARGDLYVELEKPHEIINALKTIIQADPEAMVGSRIFLSLVKEPIPECCDFLELAWLHEQGYKRMLLCDEICLKENLLGAAVNAFQAFKETV